MESRFGGKRSAFRVNRHAAPDRFFLETRSLKLEEMPCASLQPKISAPKAGLTGPVWCTVVFLVLPRWQETQGMKLKG